ncbi:hypothetical protein HZS_7303 [Henneguya salminicola]|nr:hypothetical protein HZS_7303 [Henneguya salminicola]
MDLRVNSDGNLDYFDIKYVIDPGMAYIKICSSLKFDPIITDLKKYRNFVGEKEESLINNLKNLFETNCLIQLFNRKIVLIIPLMRHEIKYNQIFEYLFDQHKVSGIYPLFDCIAALLPLGINSGLVVDFGNEYTRISPVYNYYPIRNAVKITKTSTQTLFQTLVDSVSEINPELKFKSNTPSTVS